MEEIGLLLEFRPLIQAVLEPVSGECPCHVREPIDRNHPRTFVKGPTYYNNVVFGHWVRFFNTLRCFHISN
jgi:hypothetical protein